MSNIRFLCAVALSWILASATGCREDNPYYCDDRAYDNCVNRPGEFPCSEKADCAEQAGKPACSELNEATGTGICVQCTATDSAACLGATPLCGADNLCRGCGKHSDCASAVCLADGSCGSEADVAYIAPTGAGTACTKAAPCGTLGAGVTTGKAIIKVAAGLVKSGQVTVIDGKAVTILADEGAKLDRDGDGAVLEVRSAGAEVKIFDLEITGATGSSGANGIDVNPNGGAPKLALTRVKLTGNQGLGLLAQGGAVTLSQSTIAGNTGGGMSVTGGSLALSQSTISGNTGGGISITGATFDLTNNFIYRNGNSDGGGDFGGVSLNVATGDGSRFEFNTVVDNHARAGGTTAGGLRCDVLGFAPANNIISRNDIARDVNAANSNILTAGACTYPSSIRDAAATALRFVESDQAPFNYRLGAGSSAIDQATTASPVGVDADGEARPQGAQKDIGADEYKAN